MSLRTWMLAAAAAGVTASLYARLQHRNTPRLLREGEDLPSDEPAEADELLGSADEQEQPGEYSPRPFSP